MSAKRYSDEKKTEAEQLYVQGWSLARIARQKGFPNDPKTIRKWLLTRGVRLRKAEPRYPRAKILQELDEGEDRKTLQERYGCSAKYLSQLSVGKINP